MPANQTKISDQTKLYDKIVKENMREVLPMVIREILGIEIMFAEDLPESLQHTKEKIPDQLSRITDRSGETYILHIEWQSEDDASMDNRMLSYRVMLRRKYKLPVKQYVIFLARPDSNMPYTIDEENLQFSYHLIALQRYDYKIFLESSSPEQKLMAIFGNFGEEAATEVIKKILDGIIRKADGELNTSRYVEQLRGLIQLRKLGNEFAIAMGTITKFKVEEDPFYQNGVTKGIETGEAKKSFEIVENLIVKLGLSDDQIVDVANVNLAFVEKVRKELTARS